MTATACDTPDAPALIESLDLHVWHQYDHNRHRGRRLDTSWDHDDAAIQHTFSLHSGLFNARSRTRRLTDFALPAGAKGAIPTAPGELGPYVAFLTIAEHPEHLVHKTQAHWLNLMDDVAPDGGNMLPSCFFDVIRSKTVHFVSDVLVLKSLQVHPRLRGHGLGRLLIEYTRTTLTRNDTTLSLLQAYPSPSVWEQAIDTTALPSPTEKDVQALRRYYESAGFVHWDPRYRRHARAEGQPMWHYSRTSD